MGDDLNAIVWGEGKLGKLLVGGATHWNRGDVLGRIHFKVGRSLFENAFAGGLGEKGSQYRWAHGISSLVQTNNARLPPGLGPFCSRLDINLEQGKIIPRNIHFKLFLLGLFCVYSLAMPADELFFQ